MKSTPHSVRDDTPSGSAPEDASGGWRGDGSSWPHHVLLSVFTFVWGGNFILAEVALREMAPISFSVSRFVLGAAALLTTLWVKNRSDVRRDGIQRPTFPPIRRRDWFRIVFVALLGAALAPWMGIEGLGLTDGARASLWLALGPLMSSAIGRFSGTEHLRAAGFVGITLAAIGTILLAADGLRPGQNYWLGDLLLFLSLLLVIWELHLITPLAHRYGPTPVVTLRTIIGGLCYVAIASGALVREPWLDLGGWTWFAILFGGAVGVGLGQWIKVRALNAIGPTRVVLYGNLVPIAAFLIAWLALSDVPSLLEALAAALIVSGAICLQVLDPAAGGWRVVTDSP